MSSKRAKRAPPERAARKEPASGAAEPLAESARWPMWAAIAWLIGFCLFFYSFELPNNHVPRFQIWFELLQLLPPSQLAVISAGALAERLSLTVTAAAIFAGAWGLGSLALRAIRLPVVRPSIDEFVIAMGLGLSGVSLATLGFGLAGWLARWLFLVFYAVVFLAEAALRLRDSRRPEKRLPSSEVGARQPAFSRPHFWGAVGAMALFIAVMWLGSMSPQTDFDVRAYHFQGPKEYFQNGRITFLPHNVYTNFPFLTEMFALAGMVLRGDWYWGAVVGEVVLFTFAPLTALCLFAAGRRTCGATAGLLAALVFLSTPWVYRISIIAYAEGGLSFYLAATLLAVVMAGEQLAAGAAAGRAVFVAGLFAGSGMACKYTGLMQVVLPAAIAVAALPFWLRVNRRPQALATLAAAFALGVAVTIGPWLLKNLTFTGNPVYPLAYNVFGGRGWDPQLNAKFEYGHSHHDSRTLLDYFTDVLANSDWSSPLLFGLAPLAFLVRSRRRTVTALWLLVAYLFFTWWAFTHRIDRFWVPMIPVVALLAGIGAVWSNSSAWRWVCGAVVFLAAWFNLGFVAGTDLGGYNAWFGDLKQARQAVENPFLTYLNDRLPAGSRVLCLGEGEVFEAKVPIAYNTVFNRSLFQDWFVQPAPGVPESQWKLKPPGEIRAKLAAEKITHVFVNWDWIRRYREPGNYGYTDFVRPSRFDELERLGILQTPTSFALLDKTGMSEAEIDQFRRTAGLTRRTDDGRTVLITGFFDGLSDSDLATLEALGPSLLAKIGGRSVLISGQLFLAELGAENSGTADVRK